MAIGKPELANASDDELDGAHDAHMTLMQQVDNIMDGDQGMISNSREPWRKESKALELANDAATKRRGEFMSLVNEKQAELSHLKPDEAYERAFSDVRRTRPDLCPSKPTSSKR